MRKRVNALAEQLLETLEQQGYRSTSPRRAVAQVIANQDKHFTAEDLREQLPSLGRATIFRSLKLLVETGVLCRVLLEDGDLHYQLSHRGHHHHLLCVECGSSHGGLRYRRVVTTDLSQPRVRTKRTLAGGLRPVPVVQ